MLIIVYPCICNVKVKKNGATFRLQKHNIMKAHFTNFSNKSMRTTTRTIQAPYYNTFHILGRLSWKQYIPLKRSRWGIKFFVLCDSALGYIWNTFIYVGKYSNEPALAIIFVEYVHSNVDFFFVSIKKSN